MYAEELTRFGGYRGVFHIGDSERQRHPFCWDGEFSRGVRLANNHELVIYEIPMRWIDRASSRFRPVDWERRDGSVNSCQLWEQICELVQLRKTHPVLLRNEIDFFHPAIDQGQTCLVSPKSRRPYTTLP